MNKNSITQSNNTITLDDEALVQIAGGISEDRTRAIFDEVLNERLSKALDEKLPKALDDALDERRVGRWRSWGPCFIEPCATGVTSHR